MTERNAPSRSHTVMRMRAHWRPLSPTFCPAVVEEYPQGASARCLAKQALGGRRSLHALLACSPLLPHHKQRLPYLTVSQQYLWIASPDNRRAGTTLWNGHREPPALAAAGSAALTAIYRRQRLSSLPPPWGFLWAIPRSIAGSLRIFHAAMAGYAPRLLGCCALHCTLWRRL